jgi:uncharacterized protein (DUF58 family)
MKDLQRLKQFVFKPRRILEGRYAGRHATPQRGHSVEFRDFRPYLPGDEVSRVDWKLYGRTDKLYIRVYENEAELTITLLVDASPSMAYRGAGPSSKYDQACQLAAAIAFITMQQQDRVALALADGGLRGYQAPSNTMDRLAAMLHLMQLPALMRPAALARAIQQLAGRLRRGEILIVLSDFWEDRSQTIEAISQLTHRGGEVILFHVLHDDELHLPDLEHAVFVDSESLERVRLDVGELRSTYQDRLRDHLTKWRQVCRQADIDYELVPTSRPYHECLERYLCHRTAAQ